MLKTFLVTYEDEYYRNRIVVKALHRESAKKKLKAVNPDFKNIKCKYVKG